MYLFLHQEVCNRLKVWAHRGSAVTLHIHAPENRKLRCKLHPPVQGCSIFGVELQISCSGCFRIKANSKTLSFPQNKPPYSSSSCWLARHENRSRTMCAHPRMKAACSSAGITPSSFTVRHLGLMVEHQAAMIQEASQMALLTRVS